MKSQMQLDIEFLRATVEARWALSDFWIAEDKFWTWIRENGL